MDRAADSEAAGLALGVCRWAAAEQRAQGGMVPATGGARLGGSGRGGRAADQAPASEGPAPTAGMYPAWPPRAELGARSGASR